MPQHLNIVSNKNVSTHTYATSAYSATAYSTTERTTAKYPVTKSSLANSPISVLYGNRRNGGTNDTSLLIHAARLGDETAFNKLVIYYQSAAERVAQHILHTEEAAADAVQEAFMKVYKAMKRFKDGNFRSWLLRIVTNTCYDHLRREKRRAALSLDELMEQSKADLAIQPSFFHNQIHAADPERQAIGRETMDKLMAAIDSLPIWHRNVVLLIDVHGYDYTEASEILSLPLGTIKSRLSRARSSLRQVLTQNDLGPMHSKLT